MRQERLKLPCIVPDDAAGEVDLLVDVHEEPVLGVLHNVVPCNDEQSSVIGPSNQTLPFSNKFFFWFCIQSVKDVKYWVAQKLPQICTLILRIFIGKVA